MHSPEYTKQIKELLSATRELDQTLSRCVYAFRNGRKPDSEQLESARKAYREAMAILEGAAKEEESKDD